MTRTTTAAPFLRTAVLLLAVAVASGTASSQEAAAAAGDQEDLAKVGAKLSNPVSNVWAMFTQFNLTFSDGDINTGDAQVGFNVLFQPVLPIPLYGDGEDAWKLIARPTVPIFMGSPVPQGFDDFEHQVGLGDTLLPLVVNPPAGNWLLGLGPTFSLPTSTRDAFGRQQWGLGPAGILGYKTEKLVVALFPQYFWGIGSRGSSQGSDPDASYMSMLYAFFYNLPDAWQVGFNPSLTFDYNASSGNKWNVPFGPVVAKTIRMGGRPYKFQLGAEYSVVSQEDFGQEFQFKLNVIPVVAPLIKSPLFGGS